MTGFKLVSETHADIRFRFYTESAPRTSIAFSNLLPFRRIFYHAKISGQEIWTNDAPRIDIIQENASIFTEPGEVVIGPAKPARTKTANSFGIYYGEGRAWMPAISLPGL
jgi:hypothetical protein